MKRPITRCVKRCFVLWCISIRCYIVRMFCEHIQKFLRKFLGVILKRSEEQRHSEGPTCWGWHSCGCSPYKPRTGQCIKMNHPPAILAASPSIYSTHRMLVVWIIFAHFYLCSLLGMLSCYTVLEVWLWAVWWPMHFCCGRRCLLFINILDSLMAHCLVYNTAMYTVYDRCGQYGRCIWFVHWPVQPVHGLYGPCGSMHSFCSVNDISRAPGWLEHKTDKALWIWLEENAQDKL